LLGTRLAKRLGLPTTPVAVVEVSEDLIVHGPSSIHESGHFYFAQTGHSHFAATGGCNFWTCPNTTGKMRSLGGAPMRGSYRHVATGIFIPLILAFLGFFDLTQRPTFRNFRSVDVFQLVVCGVCMGIALTGFIEFIRRAKST
jgi:hypothetical protein